MLTTTNAVSGEKGIVEPSYVYLPGVPGGDEIAKAVGVDFFAVPVELGVWFSSRASKMPRRMLTYKIARRSCKGYQSTWINQRGREETS